MSMDDYVEIDRLAREGVSSIEIWTRVGRRIGLTLEDVVRRRRVVVEGERRMNKDQGKGGEK